MLGRFTPTGVGKTRRLARSNPTSPVHPHGCGEDPPGAVNVPSCSGSPPRVWGRRYLKSEAEAAGRFTPTGVGKTLVLTDGDCWRAVHPHGCGEDTNILVFWELGITSASPEFRAGERVKRACYWPVSEWA